MIVGSLTGALEGFGAVVGAVVGIATLSSLATSWFAKRRRLRDKVQIAKAHDEAAIDNTLREHGDTLYGEGEPTRSNPHPREGVVKQLDSVAAATAAASAAAADALREVAKLKERVTVLERTG